MIKSLIMSDKSRILPQSFFMNEDILEVARALLGKILVTEFNGITTSGIIVETEAYRGLDDRASHAYPMKKTERTKTMFLDGGHCYIYLCYGLHHLFNVVAGKEGTPNAVLIRAIEPVLGFEEMMLRRNHTKFSPRLSSGPACVSQALGIDKNWNGHNLTLGESIWVENSCSENNLIKIGASTRIGVDYAGEDAKLPWRFFERENPWVSAYPKAEFITL